jgi:hypothetical protein
MRNDAIQLEEGRLRGIEKLEDYPWFKDRHRVFPAVFEDRQHKRILDTSAGVGCAAQKIRDNYQADVVCNDISPTCLKILRQLELPTVSFDIDNHNIPFPFSRSRPKAFAYRYGRWLMYHLLSPRWAAEPILCFRKTPGKLERKVRKVVL